MSRLNFGLPDTILPATGVFHEAKTYLFNEYTDEYLRLVAGTIEVDYEPIERILGLLTNLIHAKFERRDGTKNGQTVSVIPRGSFATRTAIKQHIDLDIDVIFPDCHTVAVDNQTSTIKQALEEPKKVLGYFWKTLKGPGRNIEGVRLPPPQWLQLIKSEDDITRSLSLKTTKLQWDDGELPEIPVDIFIKIQTKVRGQDIIIGVDKDSPVGKRRYQTTTFIPTEGRWLGDRILSPVDRVALLSLKWWKAELKGDTETQFEVSSTQLVSRHESRRVFFPASMVEIKSHHLLAALNALHDLDISDDLYVPVNVSQPFTLRRVKEVMWRVLEYLYLAYNPETESLHWTAGGTDLDYFFPQYSYQTMETLFMEAREDWNKFCILRASKVIPSFRDEIKSHLKHQKRPTESDGGGIEKSPLTLGKRLERVFFQEAT